nr:lysozyme inhibitor LprI family protein [Dyella sp. ASV24]
MKAIWTLALTLTTLAHGTFAVAAESTSQVVRHHAPQGIRASFYTCIDSAGSDTIAIAACLTTERAAQDARLNTTYKALLSKLRGEAKDNLVTAERAWLDFHNKSGNFESALYGNEKIADLEVTQNEVFRLCERANALEKYLSIANDL